MQCRMAPLKRHPTGKKSMHLSQHDTSMCRTNGAKHQHVQRRYPQHIPRIFSSMRFTCCQNIFGSKIVVGNVSEYFSRTTFDYGGIFLRYSKGV